MKKFTDRYTLFIHQETFDPNSSHRKSMCATAFLKIVQYVIYELTTIMPLNNRIIFCSNIKPISLSYEKKMEKFNKILCSDSYSVLVIEKTFFRDILDNLFVSNNFKMERNNHLTWHSIFNQGGATPERHIVYKYTQNE